MRACILHRHGGACVPDHGYAGQRAERARVHHGQDPGEARDGIKVDGQRDEDQLREAQTGDSLHSTGGLTNR